MWQCQGIRQTCRIYDDDDGLIVLIVTNLPDEQHVVFMATSNPGNSGNNSSKWQSNPDQGNRMGIKSGLRQQKREKQFIIWKTNGNAIWLGAKNATKMQTTFDPWQQNLIHDDKIWHLHLVFGNKKYEYNLVQNFYATLRMMVLVTPLLRILL